MTTGLHLMALPLARGGKKWVKWEAKNQTSLFIKQFLKKVYGGMAYDKAFKIIQL
jgi:hypothetical protein